MLAILGRTKVTTDSTELGAGEIIQTPISLTAFYLIADAASGDMWYANADHISPLHVRRTAKEVVALPIPLGHPLCKEKDTVYPTVRGKLNVQDLVVLYTDRLYEVDGPTHETYGNERLLKAIRKRLRRPSALIVDELLAEIRQFSTSGEFNSDVCLLGMEVRSLLGEKN